MDSPYILEETENFAVVFKPPKMHSSLQNSKQITNNKEQRTNLHEWYAKLFPSVFDIMHRLDFETHGLVLFAKNEKSYLFFKNAQKNGNFIKEYSAICNPIIEQKTSSFLTSDSSVLKGFPSCPDINYNTPFLIESYFRPYGPGRKLVRPVIEDGKKHKETAKDNGGFYSTEIINKNVNAFTVRIKRGFRHQIRCHLCWIGFPIKNDPLYLYNENDENETVAPNAVMALRAHALFFPDPAGGKQLEFRIEGLEKDDF